MEYEIEKVNSKALVIAPMSNIVKNRPADDKLRMNSRIRPVDDKIRMNSRIRRVDDKIRMNSRIRRVDDKIVKRVTKNIFEILD